MKLHVVVFGLGALVAASSSALAYNGSLSASENACLFPSHADQGSGLPCTFGNDDRDGTTMKIRQWSGHGHHHHTMMMKDTAQY